TTDRASSPESPNPNSQEETPPNVEPIFALSDAADVPDAIAWITESEGEQPPSATLTSAETRDEPAARLETAPQLPDVKSVLEAFASAIAQSPSTADRASTEIALPSRLLRVANFAQNVNLPPTEPTFAPTPFTPFERILDRFRTYTLQDRSQNEAIPADNPATGQIEPELVQAAPDVDLATPSPRSILDAFQQTILNPPLSNAESIPLPDIEIEPAPPASVPTPTQPEIVEEETVPVVPSTAPAPPQPAAVLGEIEPPNPLDSSANPLLFPTQPDEVAIDISQPITLQQALELAQLNNPTLEATRIQLDTAREALREALAAEYPTLSTQFDFTRTDSAQQEINDISRNPLIPNINNDTVTTSANAQLELNYNLLTGGRRTAQIRAAEAQVRFNQLNFESQAEQTRFEVTRAYYSLQEADSRVAIEAAAVEDARQTLRDAQLLERAGLGTRFDVLRAEVDLANSQQNLTTAESQQRTSRRELATILALGQDAIVTTADPIVQAGTWNLELEETIILAYKNRAELEQQLIQRDISEQQREVALSALRPQVNLFANYNILGIVDDDRDLADGYTVGARLQWTLFEGGAARARAAQEEKNIELAETRFDEQRNQIRLEVEQAFNNLQANEENIQTANVALQLAQESLRLARLRFQAGVGTQTDVINAQTELTRARGNLLTAIISYNQSLAALQRAVSNLPDNRLFDLP
ncbi:MAG: TolC family protein, partial [Cyanobacteriota bacterium]|nr:TolC family protein [Cyanobacteriota bacterium]